MQGGSWRGAVASVAVLLAACTTLQTSPATPTSGLVCAGGGGCWEPASPGVLVVPTCEDGACGDGVALNDRFYALLCRGVDPNFVTDSVAGEGMGTYAEARAIRDLPPELWVAVRGDVPCLPSPGQPLAHEWYLAEYADVSTSEQQQYGPIVSDVLIDH